MPIQKFEIYLTSSQYSGQPLNVKLLTVILGEPIPAEGLDMTLTYEVSGDSAVFANGKKRQVHTLKVYSAYATLYDTIVLYKPVDDGKLTNVNLTGSLPGGSSLSARASVKIWPASPHLMLRNALSKINRVL